MSGPTPMHPAEHRGLRELYAMARHLRDHWRALANRIEKVAPDQAELLREGSSVTRALIAELTEMTAARGIYGRPAAQGLGARLASLHTLLLDTTLELNQALRFAVLDVCHVATLLDFLAALAARRTDAELEAFLAGWAGKMREREETIRAAILALADDPDAAVQAAAPGLAGKAGHGLATVVGTIGEWTDRRAAR